MDSNERKARRLVLAFFLAPLTVPTLLLSVARPVSTHGPLNQSLPSQLGEILTAIFIISFLAYCMMLFVGVPTYNFLVRSKRLSILWFALCAGLIALIPPVLLFSDARDAFLNNPVDAWRVPAIFLGVGIATGIVFWLIARPDRDLDNDRLGSQ